MTFIRVFLFLLLGFFFSCSEEETKEVKTTQADTSFITPSADQPTSEDSQGARETPEEEKEIILAASPEDEQMLMLIERVPFGTNYNKVKEMFPSVKSLRPESGSSELAAKGYMETTVNINLLGKSAVLEFNFSKDSLYSFFYTISTDPDYDKGMDFFHGLQNFYSKRLGDYQEGNVEEYNHYSRSCFWNTRKFSLIMTYDINKNRVTWGYQRAN